MVKGKLCGVGKHLGTQAAARRIQASNSYPISQALASQRPGCAHLRLQGGARQMEEEGGIQHAPLLCCCTQERYTKVEGRKALASSRDRGRKTPTNPTLPAKKRKTQRKQKQQIPQMCIEISITDCMINMPRKTYNRNSYCIQCVSSALQHFCSTQRVLTCPGWDSDITHQTDSFLWFPCKAYSPSAAKTRVVIL